MNLRKQNENPHQVVYSFIRPFGNDAWLLQLSETSLNDKSSGGKGVSGLQSAFCGGIAGAVQIMITYPTEYIKTQLQLDEKGEKKLYKGSIDCIKKTYKNFGIFQFYRGMSILMYSCVPKAGVRFYILEHFRDFFGDRTGQLSTQIKLLSGLAAGTAEAVVAVTPFETMKVKFINDERSPNPQFKGIFHGIETVLKTEGIRGIYQGNTATMLKQSTNQAVRFALVESLKDLYTGDDRTKPISILATGLFGAFAGAISVYVNNPIDVVKTRMQGLEAKRYRNTWDCGVQILKNEGWQAFYKGIIPRMWRVSADVAITFMVYDKFMEWLNNLF